MSDDTIPLKHCHVCNQNLPATTEYFYRHKRNKDGLASPCIECRLGHPRKTKRTDGLRTCSVCKKDLPATEEYFYTTKRDGMVHKCKKCSSETGRNWYAENRDHRNEIAAKWRQSNRDKVRLYKRQHYARNSEKERARFRRHYQSNVFVMRIKRRVRYEANRETELAAGRLWNKNNYDKVRANANNRRARQKSAPGRFTSKDIELLFKMQKGKCWYCQIKIEKGKFHIDHRIPLSRGGSNDPSNLVLTCPTCNLRKGNKLPHEWGDRLL